MERQLFLLATFILSGIVIALLKEPRDGVERYFKLFNIILFIFSEITFVIITLKGWL